MATTYNFMIDRGSSVPAIIFKFPYDFTGSTFELTVKPSGGNAFVLSTEDDTLAMEHGVGVLVTSNGSQVSGATTTVTWAYTPEQSRLITKAEYELQQTDADGDQAIWLRGTITGIGGLNND